MNHRKLGVLDVSIVGLGCNAFGSRIDAAQTKAVVDAAIGAGINYFDTAESYGDGLSETYLGKALGSRRDKVVIASKWGLPRDLAEGERAGDPQQIRARLERSLTRLGTDYIDHYQLHRPDPASPPAETLGCLAELRAEGKIREIGCSNFSADELEQSHKAAVDQAAAPYASVQNHYSLLTRDVVSNGVLDTCDRLEIAFVPYYPLEAGVLTGKYRRGHEPPAGSRLSAPQARSRFIDDKRLDIVEELTAWAESRERTLLDLAMSWLTSHPHVASVIAGASKPDQAHANAAAGQWQLSADDRAEVDSIVNT